MANVIVEQIKGLQERIDRLTAANKVLEGEVTKARLQATSADQRCRDADQVTTKAINDKQRYVACVFGF